MLLSVGGASLLFIYLGVRVLLMLKNSLSVQTLVLKKVTLMMLGCSLGFFAFLVTLVVRTRVFVTQQELPFSEALAYNIIWDLITILMIGAILVAFSLHNFTHIASSLWKGTHDKEATQDVEAQPSHSASFGKH